MDIPCNIILRIISTMRRILTMATSHISHTEDTMDMKVVTMDKEDVMFTITNLKSAYFLPWQLTKTACLIDNVTFGQRWLRSFLLPRKMCPRDTQKVPRS
jgi:hypothetical protein